MSQRIARHKWRDENGGELFQGDRWAPAYPFQCVECNTLHSEAWRYRRGLPVCPDCGNPVRASSWLTVWYTRPKGIDP